MRGRRNQQKSSDQHQGVISEVEKRKILAKVVEMAVVAIMEAYCYKFGGLYYKQGFGGAIGFIWTG